MEFVTLNTGAKMPLEGFAYFRYPIRHSARRSYIMRSKQAIVCWTLPQLI